MVQSSKYLSFLLIVLLAVFSGCGGVGGNSSINGGDTTFSVSGQVTDATTKKGIRDVTITFSNGASAKTDTDGNYYISGLFDTLAVVAQKTGLAFEATSEEITASTPTVNFVATNAILKGKMIVRVHYNPSYYYIMNLDGSNPKTIDPQSNCDASTFRFSPDHLQVAYPGISIYSSQLCVMDMTNYNVKQLTNNEDQNYRPVWILGFSN